MKNLLVRKGDFKMKIIRVQNPVGIDYMKEHFVDPDLDREVLSNGLKAQLAADIENILILQAWDGDSLVAFVVAQNMPNQPHVFLYQAWVEPESSVEVSDKLFFRLLLWVDLLGKEEVRMETTRDTDAFTRRWKFEKFSTIMSFLIPEDFESGYVALMRKNISKDENDIPKVGTSSEETDVKEINGGKQEQT